MVTLANTNSNELPDWISSKSGSDRHHDGGARLRQRCREASAASRITGRNGRALAVTEELRAFYKRFHFPKFREGGVLASYLAPNSRRDEPISS
jgi:hypothetical protein